MTLRNKLYVTVSPPAVLSLATFYLASAGEAKWLFRMSITFLVAAILFGCVTWTVHRVQELVTEFIWLRQRVRELETSHELMGQTVNSRLATKAWREAGLSGTSARQLWLVAESLEGT